ncbi:MAG: gamma-glutamyl-phosphate reductase, partial [Proteobacteria bacterium]|nr:gamma-glutamyl-phosphate reductase [Pseudomonadota bacterium]
MSVVTSIEGGDIPTQMARLGEAARDAAGLLAMVATADKDAALKAAAGAIRANAAGILAANDT